MTDKNVRTSHPPSCSSVFGMFMYCLCVCVWGVMAWVRGGNEPGRGGGNGRVNGQGGGGVVQVWTDAHMNAAGFLKLSHKRHPDGWLRNHKLRGKSKFWRSCKKFGHQFTIVRSFVDADDQPDLQIWIDYQQRAARTWILLVCTTKL